MLKRCKIDVNYGLTHRRTRRGNYHFRAIPIEIFGQFVGLSINFRFFKVILWNDMRLRTQEIAFRC